MNDFRPQSSAYQRYVFPALAAIDAETAHNRTITALAAAQRSGPGRALLRRIAGDIPDQPVDLFGLRFPNVLGVAAGFDKDVHAAQGLALLGFGHIETGTITPLPQAGNPRPRVFRLLEDEAVINRMGFPSEGAAVVAPRLRALAAADRRYIIGVSLGKQKETPLALAAGDYIAVLQAVFPYADYLAINISSPNTPELRELQGEKYLGELLGAVSAANQAQADMLDLAPRPLLVKIAPDLDLQALGSILRAITDHDIAGIIATNTTVSRAQLRSPNGGQAGGLSGRPLAEKSLDIIRLIARETRGRLPIIAVGGIGSAGDVRARLDAGASLVQIYTALIYQGPGLAGRILRELSVSKSDL